MRSLFAKIDQNPQAAAAVATLVTTATYAALYVLGPSYALATAKTERPILSIIAIYAAAFLPYALAWRLAVRLGDSRGLLIWLLGTSLLWRVILLPTPPFQEIDIYRYLWDGRVASLGEDPYRYPPAEVVAALNVWEQGDTIRDPTLERLIEAALKDEGAYAQIVRTVHFGQYPSPYPPVSQAVFAAASVSSPSVTAKGHLDWLKLWLTGFDFATLLLVVILLRMACLPIGHAVAYGWCPLVMKEIAGSGHLDSIATFFATLAVVATVASLRAIRPQQRWLCVGVAAIALGLGVGAKLFPVVLAPLLCFVWLRRLGWRETFGGAALFLFVAATCLAPMLSPSATTGSPPAVASETTLLPPPPIPIAGRLSVTDKTAGLAAFLTRWEMNDLVFAVLLENLRPQAQVPVERRPWFAFTPDATAKALNDQWRTVAKAVWPAATGWSDSVASFQLARLLTLCAFGVIALSIAWRAGGDRASATVIPRAAFLTLAWFWLLAPTQNPWYWCWALPLLPFARCRAWSLLAACLLMYYLRFWLEYHCPQPPVLGTSYDGEYFFYFVVAWVEYLPWFVILAAEAVWLGRRDPA